MKNPADTGTGLKENAAERCGRAFADLRAAATGGERRPLELFAALADFATAVAEISNGWPRFVPSAAQLPLISATIDLAGAKMERELPWFVGRRTFRAGLADLHAVIRFASGFDAHFGDVPTAMFRALAAVRSLAHLLRAADEAAFARWLAEEAVEM